MSKILEFECEGADFQIYKNKHGNRFYYTIEIGQEEEADTMQVYYNKIVIELGHGRDEHREFIEFIDRLQKELSGSKEDSNG